MKGEIKVAAGKRRTRPGVGKRTAALRSKVKQVSAEVPLSNSQIAELFALEAEKAEGHFRRALLTAARSAFIWPEEASLILQRGDSLTTLPSIGPSLARMVQSWIEQPPELQAPPEIRRQFLTLAEARRVLDANPEWRSACNGDLQMHSEWSDGAAPIASMAEEGMERGYQYICITDHTKGLKIAGGISEAELEAQRVEIDGLNRKLAKRGFRVLQGAEMNIRPDGSGDMDATALRRLDFVLGSFHSALRLKEDQTTRYLAALSNPEIHALGHPRGRVYNYRHGLTADWRKVFAHAAKLDKAVEIDGYSDRQDLPFDLLQIAKQEGVRISMGSDAHSPEQLAFLDISLALAFLAGIPRDRILNFMNATELAAWVKALRH